MPDSAALNADIAAILQTEITEHLAHPPANPEAFWTYLAGVVIATPGMQEVISEADEVRAQHQRELQAISLWQERYSARTKAAEATIARVEGVARSMEDIADHGAFIKRDIYDYTTALREALNPSKDAS